MMYLRIIQMNLFVLFDVFVVSKPDSNITKGWYSDEKEQV